MSVLVGTSMYRGYLGTGTPDANSFFRGDGTWQESLDISGTSGGQIKFPATQNASSDANTLDDYEEGTFTPAVESSGGGVPTYTTQLGYYTKIGDRVYISIRITLASTGTLAAGTLFISGLPFSSRNVTFLNSAVLPNGTNFAVGVVTQLTGSIVANTSSVALTRFSAGTQSNLMDTDLTNTSIFNISGVYPV